MNLENSLASPAFGHCQTRVLIAAPKSDCHVVAITLLSDFLRGIGVKVDFMGCCTSVSELDSALRRAPSITHVVIGTSNGHAVKDLEGLERLKTTSPRTKIVVGGKVDIVNADDGYGFAPWRDAVDLYFRDLLQCADYFLNLVSLQEAAACE
jgi:methylmalonyl-CoA mutase cobalamin-binding subunit